MSDCQCGKRTGGAVLREKNTILKRQLGVGNVNVRLSHILEIVECVRALACIVEDRT